ncbi:MAG: GxxExxY protein [Planctomycetota bacterium]|jgi:GxxExxY protein|nr:GxxExxY protein [Planctomycetota bacterium]
MTDEVSALVSQLREGGPSTKNDELTGRVIACALAVHSSLGPGYKESVYERAMLIELAHNGLTAETQHCFDVLYRGKAVGQGRVDLLVEKRLIVELKSCDTLIPLHTAQAISYLVALDLPVALLINFNTSQLKRGLKRVTAPHLYRP